MLRKISVIFTDIQKERQYHVSHFLIFDNILNIQNCDYCVISFSTNCVWERYILVSCDDPNTANTNHLTAQHCSRGLVVASYMAMVYRNGTESTVSSFISVRAAVASANKLEHRQLCLTCSSALNWPIKCMQAYDPETLLCSVNS